MQEERGIRSGERARGSGDVDKRKGQYETRCEALTKRIVEFYFCVVIVAFVVVILWGK